VVVEIEEVVDLRRFLEVEAVVGLQHHSRVGTAAVAEVVVVVVELPKEFQ
jgi:hypothetical protein